MEAIIERVEKGYFICRRQDGVIIDIPIKFIKTLKIGDVLIVPYKRQLN
ncbi:hypothetical protein [Clostridium lundense]|nr:hypothetical protein [Clostridium lundense]